MPSDLELKPTVYETCLMYFGHGMRIKDIASARGYSRRGIQNHLAAARERYPHLREYHGRHRLSFNPFA